MRAEELISEIIPPLKYNETGEKALNWMNEFRVSHLPVVSGNQYIGLVSESDVYDMPDPSLRLDECFLNLPKPFIYVNQHAYEVMKLISDSKITVVPILDENNEYIGCTDLLFLMSAITAVVSIKEPGGIIVLSMNTHDYTLTEIARIVEENNAKILSSYITSASESTEIEVTIKVNTNDLDRIIHTLNRYGYVITGSYGKGNRNNDLKRRYEELLNYLNM